MTLLPIEKTSIVLPEIILQNKKIGKNFSKRYGIISQEIEVEIYNSTYDGWFELRTKAAIPCKKIFLKIGKKDIDPMPNEFCLVCPKNIPIGSIDRTTKFNWIQHLFKDDKINPIEISKSWSGCFKFQEDRPDLNQKGLRLPQLGALHSISAYFSLKKNIEPATIVLPTGTGKTETMLATLIYKQLPKVLIIVPSTSLREQISNKFYSLGCLAEIGAICKETLLPSVTAIKSGIKDISEAKDLLKYTNVFVATTQVLNSSDPRAIDHLCNGITDLFIDEAHHVSAKTWNQIKNRFKQKRIIQYTATPFRNDGSNLDGKIIYNYTMGEAQSAGYFKHIDLIPVEEYMDEKRDRIIAEKAVNILKQDIDKGLNHLLMARVEKKARAEEIYPIYNKIVPEFNPIIVHSGMSKRDIEKSLDQLFSGQSKIVICVNMLGEGFDLPALKVAAIHDIHKSLAITLQFIGRFTRQSNKASIGDASVIVNTADVEVEVGLENLYSQGAEWDGILRRLSEERISKEVQLQEVIDKLKQRGDLHNQLSLWNLRPVFSAMLFNAPCYKWNPEAYKAIIPRKTDHWHAISESENMLIVLALHQSPVQWGNYKELHDNLYKLMIVKWDKERSALFVYSNDYNCFKVERLVKEICDEKCELLSGSKIFNIFNGVEYPLVRNLGASQQGAISFAQYFGSNVTEGLNKIESASSSLNNIAGLGYENGDKVIWGCSQKKGKIWSVTGGSISEWSNWVTNAWDKIAEGNIDENNITRDFLRPQKIDNNYKEYACSISWGEHIQSSPEDRVIVQFGSAEIPLYMVDIEIINQGNGLPYEICIKSDTEESIYTFNIDSQEESGFIYKYKSGKKITIKKGSAAERSLEEYLKIDPWVIHYIDGSYSYNCYLIQVPQTHGEFPSNEIETLDWSGIDITKESMGKHKKQDTIQWKSFENLLNTESYDVIINDDGPGEAADLIALKVVEEEIYLTLVHCKYSSASDPGARINDFYNVCGQAQKSIKWKHLGMKYLYDHINHRERLWQKEGASRFIKGTIRELATIKKRARTAKLKLSIQLIQPGLKKDSVTPDILRVLGGTQVYVQKTAQADLTIIGS